MLKIDVQFIAKNIRQLRSEKGYSQEYMAHKMEISQNTYSKLELGNNKITVERLIQVAHILDADIAVLLQNNG